MAFPKKSLGQNFLVDPNYRRKILASLHLSPSEEVLEIGPGRGALTFELASQAGKLWLIEKDRDLAARLAEAYREIPSVSVFPADFLEADLGKILEERDGRVKAVGNLPYNVASQIFIKLLEERRYFSDLYLMFQKEMALRFTAKPGTKGYGLLTLWAKLYTECSLLFHLPPTAFKPAPKVSSSFLHFSIRAEPLLSEAETPAFFSLMRELFQKRRKTIRTVLRDFVGVPAKAVEALVERNVRAEDLSVDELLKLSRRFSILPNHR